MASCDQPHETCGKEEKSQGYGYCVRCGDCSTFDHCPGRAYYGIDEDSRQCFCCGYREKEAQK